MKTPMPAAQEKARRGIEAAPPEGATWPGPLAQLPPPLRAKFLRLQEIVRRLDPLIVAYSGGTDSALLVKVAHDLLGDRMIALTARSASLPEEEFEAAERFVTGIGARHLVVEAHELEREEYASNPVNRCYFCKSELYEICEREAKRLGWPHIADGTNRDDLTDWRPGRQAAQERKIHAPLSEAGLTKAEVRTLSRALGLETWDKPAMPCLSSRFPYGVAIDRERLARVAAAERVMKAHGFRTFRVRFHEEIARLEVGEGEIERLLDPALRETISREIRRVGFRFVTLDLEGYRSGRLNEGIVAAEQ